MSERRFPEPFAADMTLEDAQDLLRGLADDGACCPMCTQNVKVYRRPLNAVVAKALVALYAECGRSSGRMALVARRRLPEVASQGGFLTLGHHWGLMAADLEHTGHWRITDLGERWLHGSATVPKYVRIFNGRRLGQPSGDPVSIHDALGESFDLPTLLSTPGDSAGHPLFALPDPPPEAQAA